MTADTAGEPLRGRGPRPGAPGLRQLSRHPADFRLSGSLPATRQISLHPAASPPPGKSPSTRHPPRHPADLPPPGSLPATRQISRRPAAFPRSRLSVFPLSGLPAVRATSGATAPLPRQSSRLPCAGRAVRFPLPTECPPSPATFPPADRPFPWPYATSNLPPSGTPSHLASSFPALPGDLSPSPPARHLAVPERGSPLRRHAVDTPWAPGSDSSGCRALDPGAALGLI